MPGIRHSVPQGPDINFKDTDTGKRSVKPGHPAYTSRVFDNPITDRDGLLTGAYEGCPRSDTWLPDFDDAGTRGCLVEMVRKAWGDENAFADPRGGWHVCISSKGQEHGHDMEIEGDSETDAWVAALEAAP